MAGPSSVSVISALFLISISIVIVNTGPAEQPFSGNTMLCLLALLNMQATAEQREKFSRGMTFLQIFRR